MIKGSGRRYGCISRHEKELSRPGSRVECLRLCWEGPEGSGELDLEEVQEPVCHVTGGGESGGGASRVLLGPPGFVVLRFISIQEICIACLSWHCAKC